MGGMGGGMMGGGMMGGRLAAKAPQGQSSGTASRSGGKGRGAQPAPGSYAYPSAPAQQANAGAAIGREEAQQTARASVRQVGAKTFYFKDNRWIDSTVKPDEDAKAKRIRQFSDEFFGLARSQSAELNQYLTFTEPVTLKLAGTVYRIDPAESK